MVTRTIGRLSITVPGTAKEITAGFDSLMDDIRLAEEIKLAAATPSDMMPDDVVNIIAHRDVNPRVIFLLARFSVTELTEYKEQLKEEKRQEMSDRGKSDKKSKWARCIATELRSNAPDATFPELWAMIPEDYGTEGKRYAGFEVYREGDVLMASSRNRNEELKKESFRTGYIVKKKNKKH